MGSCSARRAPGRHASCLRALATRRRRAAAAPARCSPDAPRGAPVHPRAGRAAARTPSSRSPPAARGFRLEVLPTRGPEHCRELALRAVSERLDAVFALGGDGTLRVVAGALAGSQTAWVRCPGHHQRPGRGARTAVGDPAGGGTRARPRRGARDGRRPLRRRRLPDAGLGRARRPRDGRGRPALEAARRQAGGRGGGARRWRATSSRSSSWRWTARDRRHRLRGHQPRRVRGRLPDRAAGARPTTASSSCCCSAAGGGATHSPSRSRSPAAAT